MEAGYTTCCAHGFCAGYPATCSCNPDCHYLGDCCSDIEEVCPAGKFGHCCILYMCSVIDLEKLHNIIVQLFLYHQLLEK